MQKMPRQTLLYVSLFPGVKKRMNWLVTALGRKQQDLLFFVQDNL